MMVFLLQKEGAELPGRHRIRPGWAICQEGGRLWLRCPEADEEHVAGLPYERKFRTGEGRRLVPWGGTVPVALAPAGPWQDLKDFLQPRAPAGLMPGQADGGMEIKLERCPGDQQAEGLLTDLPTLLGWADGASRHRMARLKFAAAGDGRVFVAGTPLPPLPGSVFYFAGPLALPCGWAPAGLVRTEWVERVLRLPEGAVALFAEPRKGPGERDGNPADGRAVGGETEESGGGYELLPQEAFAPLSLAALRRTLRARGSATRPFF